MHLKTLSDPLFSNLSEKSARNLLWKDSRKLETQTLWTFGRPVLLFYRKLPQMDPSTDLHVSTNYHQNGCYLHFQAHFI